jgi:hypothetical protein
MNFKTRLEIAERMMMEKRVPNVEHGNNLHALLRLLGVNVRPPHFSSFSFNLAFYGSAYAIPCGLLAWFSADTEAGIVGTLASLLPLPGILGLWKAMHYSTLRTKYDLPAWSDLHPPANVFD